MKNLVHPIYFILYVVLCFSTSYKINAQSGLPLSNGEYTIYYPTLSVKGQDFEKIKLNITEVLKKVNVVYDYKTKSEILSKDIKDIYATNDGIEIIAKSKKNNKSYSFKSLIDSTMVFYSYKNTWDYIHIPSVANFIFSNIYEAQKLADNIYFIQYPLIEKRVDSLLTIFKPLALEYKSAKVKPTITEEQRKLYIQADGLYKLNDYFGAIKTYNKLIEINPISFPAIYSNLALLSAQVNYFDYAIFYMQKYLLLETNPAEIRKAQDKIYEWEGLIGK